MNRSPKIAVTKFEGRLKTGWLKKQSNCRKFREGGRRESTLVCLENMERWVRVGWREVRGEVKETLSVRRFGVIVVMFSLMLHITLALPLSLTSPPYITSLIPLTRLHHSLLLFAYLKVTRFSIVGRSFCLMCVDARERHMKSKREM